MADHREKGETAEAGETIGRRAALTRLGLGASVAYVAPMLLTLSSAQAGVVVGDGTPGNDKSKVGGGSGSSGSSGPSGPSAGSGPSGSEKAKKKRKGRKGKKSKKGKKRARMSVKELLDYLGNLGKRQRRRK